MSTKPWYAWYPGDWKAKTSHLSLAEKGAYRELLDHGYSTGRGLPNDMEKLCRIVGASNVTEITTVKNIIDEFYTLESDNLLHNRRIDNELIKQQEFIEEQRRKGKLSAQARWGIRNGLRVTEDNRGVTEGVTEGVTGSQPNDNLPQPQPLSQPHPQSTTTPKSKTPRTSRKMVPPDDWKPNEETAATMSKEFALPTGAIQRYTDAFLDYCKAHQKPYVDFNAAFRNCVRQDWPKFRANGAMRPQPKTAADLIDEAQAKPH